MLDTNILTIRLLPDGFYISECFYPVIPGADFDQRLMEAMLDAEIAELNRDNIDSVQCIIETNRFCLSPASTPSATAEEMFHLTNTDASGDEVLLHDIDETRQIRFSFAMSASIYHFLLRTLPDAEIHLDIFDLHQAHNRERGFYVKADKNAISLLGYQEGNLQICNRIETQGENNQCYFILAAWNQLGFDPIVDTLELSTDNERLQKTVNTYIKCVS